MIPARMPASAGGTVCSVSPLSQTIEAVGASSAYPSRESQITSSAPCRAAQRRAAKLPA